MEHTIEIEDLVVPSTEGNRLYIIPFPELHGIITARYQAILAALPNEIPDPVRVAAEAPTLTFGPYLEALN